MRYLSLLLFSFILTGSAFAQNRQVVTLPLAAHATSAVLDNPFAGQPPFASYVLRWEGAATPWQIRFSTDGRSWGDWQTMARDEHVADILVSRLAFATGADRYYQLRNPAAAERTASLHFYQPGETGPVRLTAPTAPTEGARACPCPFPAVAERSDWCPTGDCDPVASPTPTIVSHLIVHHSAGTNTSNDWAAVVRSIYDFHVNTLGWDDVGYNYLIDPNGVIYVARGNDTRGAHFCGTNTGTMGVCVLGNFTEIAPTPAAIDALVSLLSWKSCDRDISPVAEAYHFSSQLVLPRIAGHQDGCATECPGDSFYPLLPAVRDATLARIVSGCSGLPGPYPLVAQYDGNTTVDLIWDDNTEGEAGYLLERQDGPDAEFTLRAQLIADTETYQDEIDPAVVYRYRVVAFTLTDTSAYSNEVEVAGILTDTRQPSLDGLLTARLSPNPGTDLLQIDLLGAATGSVTLRIYNALGQQFALRQIEKDGNALTETLVTAQWPSGNYRVQLEMDGKYANYTWLKN